MTWFTFSLFLKKKNIHSSQGLNQKLNLKTRNETKMTTQLKMQSPRRKRRKGQAI